jgi:predicted metalloprotease
VRARVVAVVLVVLASTASTMSSAAAVPRASSSNQRAAYEASIRSAVAAIETYWKREYPLHYGERYVPVGPERVFAAEPGVKIPPCQGVKLSYRDAAGNAFYCYEDNFVVYDDAQLFPKLYQAFGPFSIALVLAHEWGHAIQDRAENDREATIYKELQSDCFAGAWTRHQAERGARASGPELAPGDLESSLAALLQFRDVPGTSPDDP